MKTLFAGVCNSQPVVSSAFLWSVLDIKKPCLVKFGRAVNKYSSIRNNQLIQAFLGSGYDYFVKMDVDQIYPSDYFEKMVPLIDEYKVIGPLIFDRWAYNNFAPLVFKSIEPDKAYPVNIAGKEGIEAFPYCHTNCFYAREVLESIKPPWYDVEFTDDCMAVKKNADRYFIQKVLDAGYKTHINFDVVVQHIPELGINKQFHARWNGL